MNVTVIEKMISGGNRWRDPWTCRQTPLGFARQRLRPLIILSVLTVTVQYANRKSGGSPRALGHSDVHGYQLGLRPLKCYSNR